MPMDKKRYPADWPVIALEIKTAANWTCEHCGKPCYRPGEKGASILKRLKGTHWEQLYWEHLPGGGLLQHPRRFLLTCAHLNHDPMDCRKENLRAWCTPCHARYDIRSEAIAIKQLLKQGYDQLTLL